MARHKYNANWIIVNNNQPFYVRRSFYSLVSLRWYRSLVQLSPYIPINTTWEDVFKSGRRKESFKILPTVVANYRRMHICTNKPQASQTLKEMNWGSTTNEKFLTNVIEELTFVFRAFDFSFNPLYLFLTSHTGPLWPCLTSGSSQVWHYNFTDYDGMREFLFNCHRE